VYEVVEMVVAATAVVVLEETTVNESVSWAVSVVEVVVATEAVAVVKLVV